MADEQKSLLPEIGKVWNYKDPAGTEGRFREILERAAGEEHAGYRAEVWTQVARCLGLQGKFGDAHGVLDGVEKRMDGLETRVRVRYLLERGRVFNSSGEAARGLPLFEEAWRVAEEAGELRLAGDAVHMVAIAQPDWTGQVKWNLEALGFIERHPSEKGWLFAVYNNLGEAYAAGKDYEKGLKYFRELAGLYVARGEAVDPYTEKDIAKMLRMMGRVAEALRVIGPVHEKWMESKGADGWLDEELAECLAGVGRAGEAKGLFVRAYEGLRSDEWVLRHDPEKLVRLKRMADG